MRIFLKLWPIFLLPIVAIPLNVDFSIIPNLRAQGVLGAKLFYISAFLATMEMFYWYWFWGWVGREITNLKKIRGSVELGKEITKEIKNDHYVKNRYVKRIIDHVLKQYEWATNLESWPLRLIRCGEYVSMILLGAEPFVAGGRLFGIIYCRIKSWHRGFIILSIANISHIAIMVWGWSKLFSFFGW